VPSPVHNPHARAEIDSAATYTFRASVWLRDAKVFESAKPQPVLTHGAPDNMHVVLRPGRVRAADAPDGKGYGTTAPAATITALVRVSDDGNLLRVCGSRELRPVTTEGDYAALEKAYLAAGTAQDQSVLVSFEGSITLRPRIDGDGSEEAWYVERFVKLMDGSSCPSND
jgi:hypothetical protein